MDFPKEKKGAYYNRKGTLLTYCQTFLLFFRRPVPQYMRLEDDTFFIIFLLLPTSMPKPRSYFFRILPRQVWQTKEK